MPCQHLWICVGVAVSVAMLAGQSGGQDQPDPSAVGPVGDATALPTSQLIRPAGESIQFGGRPVDIVLSPDGNTLYAKDNRGLVVINCADWSLRQELDLPGGGSMIGLTVSADGSRIYASLSNGTIAVASVRPDGTLALEKSITPPGPGGQGNAFACGIALVPGASR